MNKETAKKWAEIFQAIAEGKDIEYYNNLRDEWYSFEPEDHFQEIEKYRIKSKLEYIPFEWSDWNKFMGQKVRRKGENFKDEIWEIHGVNSECILIADRIDEYWHTFEYVFTEYEFIDGKPFGKIK